MDSVVAATGDRLKQLTTQMRLGSLSIPAWQQQMVSETKALHLATAAAARGGWAQMSQADFGWVGQRLRTEYAFLNNFATEVASGKQPINKTLEARAALYAEAARSTSREMERRMGVLAGMDMERNELGIADHCGDCLDATSAGWVPIGTLEAVGNRQCGRRCACAIVTGTPQQAA